MPFETLKKGHVKRNILIGLLMVGIISTIILNFTRAKYRVTESIPLVNGTINYSPGDIIISAYFNGELLENFPTKDDGYAVKTVTCDKGASATFDEEEWKVSIDNLVTKGTKCDVTFVEKVSAKDTILANYSTVLTRNDFSITVSNTTTGTVYKSLDETQYDNDGEVYYFAGNPTDNWFYFGGFYWRIIRINGNGTIRMIYQGTSATTTGAGTQIGMSAFNTNYNDNTYVGYMYGTPGSSTYEATHANTNDSTIKQTLDNWYTNESGLINYSEYLDGNVGFCGDREPSTDYHSSNGSGGIGTTNTYYGYYIRSIVNIPTFKCQNSSDLYTTSGSTNGNKALINPIGLISMDEVWYAGGYQTANSNYYLYTNQVYWTITPGYYINDSAGVFIMSRNGSLGGSDGVEGTWGVRPVINLKADIKLTGSGTTTDPYRVEGA